MTPATADSDDCELKPQEHPGPNRSHHVSGGVRTGRYTLVGGRTRSHQCATAADVVAALVGRRCRLLVRDQAGRIYAGEALLPTASPLPFFAYPILVATFLGWAWMLVRADS
jgi:hypothetical protein